MSKIIQPNSAVTELAEPQTKEYYISEIFHSLQGEGLRAGERCVFVRLQGCTLRCTWCDTKYALDHRNGGMTLSGQDIIDNVFQYDCSFVEFTGGEPLEQENVYPLMKWFCDNGFTVAVETGGHIDTNYVDPRVIRIIDMKCPDSKMVSLNNYDNLKHLRAHDEIKFVIASREDYEWAKSIVQEYNLVGQVAVVLFSSVFSILPLQVLAEWILVDKLNVRMQVQMHKFIWHPDTRGV